MLLFQAYDKHLEQLTDVARRACLALDGAGIPYRIVGGLAVFFHVHARDPLLARLTRDVDLAVNRADLSRIAETAKPLGLEYRHVAGVDMLVDATGSEARSAVHFVFAGEKVRSNYLEAVPQFSPTARSEGGFLLAPVSDLVKMKLTSFRLKDKTHLKDLDEAGLITPEIEAGLSEPLRERLKEVRASE